MQFRDDYPWWYGIDSDPFRSQLEGNATGELVEGRLGNAVSQHSGEWTLAIYAAEQTTGDQDQKTTTEGGVATFRVQ